MEMKEWEPVVGSIVIDSEGDAWKRYNNGWWCTADTELTDGIFGAKWKELLSECGPLNVLYTPAASND